jgi:hypothetical protein
VESIVKKDIEDQRISSSHGYWTIREELGVIAYGLAFTKVSSEWPEGMVKIELDWSGKGSKRRRTK